MTRSDDVEVRASLKDLSSVPIPTTSTERSSVSDRENACGSCVEDCNLCNSAITGIPDPSSDTGGDAGSPYARSAVWIFLKHRTATETTLFRVIETMQEPLRAEMMQVLGDLHAADPEQLLVLFNFLDGQQIHAPVFGSLLSEVIKFSELRHRVSVRACLPGFLESTAEGYVDPAVMSDARVLSEWLRIYARALI